MEKEYLGDGVYADIDKYGQICLTTENGIETTNMIYLDPGVVERLTDYCTRARAERGL